MGFETYNPNALPAPLNGDFGRLIASTLGAQQDDELELLATAMRCHLPAKCPDDALDHLGQKFKIERYDGETHDSYRARLMAAFTTWELAGSAAGIEAQLVAFGIADATCYAAWEGSFSPDPDSGYPHFWIVLGPDWGTLAIEEMVLPTLLPIVSVDDAGDTVRVDPNPFANGDAVEVIADAASTLPGGLAAATRYYASNSGTDVSLYTDAALTTLVDITDVGVGTFQIYKVTVILGGTDTLGTTATLAQILAVKRIILKWKAAHGYPVKILALFGAGPVLGVGPLTLGSFTLGGASVISWPIGRTLNDTLPTLGSTTFILGGYQL